MVVLAIKTMSLIQLEFVSLLFVSTFLGLLKLGVVRSILIAGLSCIPFSVVFFMFVLAVTPTYTSYRAVQAGVILLSLVWFVLMRRAARSWIHNRRQSLVSSVDEDPSSRRE